MKTIIVSLWFLTQCLTAQMVGHSVGIGEWMRQYRAPVVNGTVLNSHLIHRGASEAYCYYSLKPVEPVAFPFDPLAGNIYISIAPADYLGGEQAHTINAGEWTHQVKLSNSAALVGISIHTQFLSKLNGKWKLSHSWVTVL